MEYELSGYEEHERDSANVGDARRCRFHPHVKTSSDDGMFDAPCYECEGAMDAEADDSRYVASYAGLTFKKLRGAEREAVVALMRAQRLSVVRGLVVVREKRS